MGLAIHILVVNCMLISIASTQTEGLESCNVVCNCNAGQPSETRNKGSDTVQGLPGKLGPKGDIGPTGAKGQKGDSGLKGERGNEPSMAEVLLAMSAISCQDLKSRYHISSTGHYLMMDPNTTKPVYNYCDFKIYTDAATCEELLEKYNITERGEYILGRNSDRFQLCDKPTAFNGIYTCQALHDRYAAITESGFYQFKSPGSDAFQVYCNFSHTPVSTEVRHDLMGETLITSTCEQPGCFAISPSYEVDTFSMSMIIGNSESCRQFIKLRCQGVLLGWKGQFNRGWWIAGDGEKMSYWGGATTNGNCACGETRTCVDNTHKCNCDNNSESRITSDEGYLTDKTKLPLQSMKIGDMGGQNEMAWYTVGKLECFGQV